LDGMLVRVGVSSKNRYVAYTPFIHQSRWRDDVELTSLPNETAQSQRPGLKPQTLRSEVHRTFCPHKTIIAQLLYGRRPQRGAQGVRKFGNLSIRNILVVTSAYVRPYRLWGRGRGVPRQPNGEGECHLFLAVNRAVLLAKQRFS